MPVNAMVILYLLQHSITASSLKEPPGCAINSTPLPVFRRSTMKVPTF